MIRTLTHYGQPVTDAYALKYVYVRVSTTGEREIVYQYTNGYTSTLTLTPEEAVRLANGLLNIGPGVFRTTASISA